MISEGRFTTMLHNAYMTWQSILRECAFIDFRKAFDCSKSRMLLHGLLLYDIDGICITPLRVYIITLSQQRN